MKVAILGYNVEGVASYDYYLAQGHELTICDRNTELEVPEGAQVVLGDTYLDDLDRFDLLIRSPGLHPKQILHLNPSVKDKITTQTNEFLSVCPTNNIIGVTGTKGKGTTSSLIAAILKQAGNRVHIGGNIGVPVFDLLKAGINENDYVVLELSNFQLIDAERSPHIAVCLMVVSEHLDWHPDKAEYFEAKRNIFSHQTTDDVAIYYADNKVSEDLASSSPGAKIPYYKSPGAEVIDDKITIDGQAICHTDELKLLGKHNWQNVCAAVTAVWQVTQEVEVIHEAVTSFVTMEHRLEFVREFKGTKYYNDSFGTTPETAIVAIEAFEEPKVLIIGGSDKGADYDQLGEVIASSNMRKVILIGEQAERLKQAFTKAGFDNTVSGGETMQEIVKTSCEYAQPGDTVLLSAATASFDMFKNYKDRGNQFKQAVQALA